MKFTVIRPVEVDIKKLKVKVERVNWEDWPVNQKECENGVGHPLFNGGDGVEFIIDVESGRIDGWPVGNTMETWDKVRDEGEYELYGKNNELILHKDCCYVPDVLDTRGDGYADYMQFSVNANGVIDDWNPYDIEKMLTDTDGDY